jgi:hypothetical protein
MREINFAMPAELFAVNCGQGRPKQMIYRRFENAAFAVRFVIEELSAPQRNASVLEINELRHGYREICALYGRDDYPLRRKKGKDPHGNEAKLPVRTLGTRKGESAEKSRKAASQG